MMKPALPCVALVPLAGAGARAGRGVGRREGAGGWAQYPFAPPPAQGPLGGGALGCLVKEKRPPAGTAEEVALLLLDGDLVGGVALAVKLGELVGVMVGVMGVLVDVSDGVVVGGLGELLGLAVA